MELVGTLEEGISSCTGGVQEWPFKLPYELGKRCLNIGIRFRSVCKPAQRLLRSVNRSDCLFACSMSLDGLS